jgi:histidine triad (HIT) family protein
MKQILFSVARWKVIGFLIGWVFEHMSKLLPVKRIFETDQFIVFEHPKPIYALHLLIIPKKAIPDFAAVDGNSVVWKMLPDVVGGLVKQFSLEDKGYRLITNVGEYQDVSQLHFHLVSGDSLG